MDGKASIQRVKRYLDIRWDLWGRVKDAWLDCVGRRQRREKEWCERGDDLAGMKCDDRWSEQQIGWRLGNFRLELQSLSH